MKSGIASSVVAVAGFTGLGVAAIYLLDPQQGERRRKAILAAAERATASTGEAVQATVDRASGSVRTAASAADDYAHDLIDRVTDKFSSATDSTKQSVFETHAKAKAAIRDHIHTVAGAAKGWFTKATNAVSDTHDDLADRVGTIKSRASGYRDQAQSAYEDYRSRSRGAADHLAGKHEGHPALVATGITAGSVGVLALGAGLAYFLDPQQGENRRAEVLDGATSWARRVGFSLRQYGRHLVTKDLPADNDVSNPGETPYRGSNGSEVSSLQSTESLG